MNSTQTALFLFSPLYSNFNNFCQFYFLNISWILLLSPNTMSTVPVQVLLSPSRISVFAPSNVHSGQSVLKCKAPIKTLQRLPIVNRTKPQPCTWHVKAVLWPSDVPLLFLNSLLLHKLSPLQWRSIYIDGQRGKMTYQENVRGRIWILLAMFLTTVLCCPLDTIANSHAWHIPGAQ